MQNQSGITFKPANDGKTVLVSRANNTLRCGIIEKKTNGWHVTVDFPPRETICHTKDEAMAFVSGYAMATGWL